MTLPARRLAPALAVVALGLLSLVGLPPTSGLWGKLTLVVGAAEAPGWQAWVLVGSVVAASVLSTMALQRVWAEIFWGPPMERYRTDNAQTRLSEPVALPDDVRIGVGACNQKHAHVESVEHVLHHAEQAVQLFGGMGVTRGAVVEALYREVRALRIYEGASEVQKLVIARAHLAEAEAAE